MHRNGRKAKKMTQHIQKKTILLISLIFICMIISAFVFHLVKFSMYKHVFEEEDEIPSRFYLEFKSYNNVPLVIHQIWTKNTKIPSEWVPAQNSWLHEVANFNKSLKPVYMLWNETHLNNFMLETFPWFYKTYTNYKYFIQRIDAARYFILYYYGGIYSDLDIEVRNKAVESFLDTIKRDIGVAVLKTVPTGVSTSVIVSTRKHPFMKRVINGLKAANTGYVFPYLTVMLSTGPVYLYTKYALYKKKSQIHIIYPEHAKKMFNNYHGGTWHEVDGKIIWFVYSYRYIFLYGLQLFVVVCVAFLLLKKINFLQYVCHRKSESLIS